MLIFTVAMQNLGIVQMIQYIITEKSNNATVITFCLDMDISGTTYKCENPCRKCSKLKYVVPLCSPQLLMYRWF